MDACSASTSPTSTSKRDGGDGKNDAFLRGKIIIVFLLTRMGRHAVDDAAGEAATRLYLIVFSHWRCGCTACTGDARATLAGFCLNPWDTVPGCIIKRHFRLKKIITVSLASLSLTSPAHIRLSYARDDGDQRREFRVDPVGGYALDRARRR